MEKVISQKSPDFIPNVLLHEKENAKLECMGKKKGWDKAWDKGPWDKGHWTNRK